MAYVNLIPASILARQACEQRLRRWGVLVALAAVTLVVPLVAGRMQQSRAIAMERRLERLVAERAALREAVRRVTDEARQATLQLERAKALRGKRAWSQLLAIVVDQLPEACWLFSIATDPPSPTGAVRVAQALSPAASTAETGVAFDAPRRLRLVGFASKADEPHEFVTNLRRTNIFRDVVLNWTKAEPGANEAAFRFELFCEW